MKKIGRKKLIAVMIMFLIFIMTGCENKKKQEDTNEMVYEATELIIEGTKGEPALYCVKESNLYILSCQRTAGIETFEEETFQFYKVDLDENNLIEIGKNLPKTDCVNAFLVRGDGGITYMASHAEETEEIHYELVKLDMDGNELLREDITKSLNLLPDSLLGNIVEDVNGKVILSDTQMVYILDESFQLVGQVEVKDGCQLIDFARTKDGQIVCVESKEKESHISTKVCTLNVERHRWGKEIKLDIDFNINYDCITDGEDYDFYYKNNGICGYDMAEKKGTKVLDSTVSYLTKEDVNGIVPAGDGRFIGMIYGYGMEEANTILGVYTKVDPSVIENKQTITYATYGVTDVLTRAAREFNKENKDYRIEFKEYNSDGGEDYTRMRADIAAGKVPDIINISYLGLSLEQCVEKGLLEDLTPYYENDSEVSIEDLIPAVSEAMKIDGKFYYLAPYFSINTVVGKTRNVGTGTGWTFDELKALLTEKGNDVIPFSSNEKIDILSCFLLNGLTDFVDWETGKCSFDSQDFKDILELCNRGENENEYCADQETGLREGKILLKAYDSGVSLSDIQADRQIFGEDITYIGYPNKEKQGSYFDFVDMVGIYSKSPAKDKAWEFLHFVMTKEYQAKIVLPDYYAMPTRQDCFDLRVKALITTEAYIDEFGQEIEPREKGSYMGIEYGPISQKDVDIFVNLMNHTKRRTDLDEKMIEIVMEEAQAYFEGDKSLDETTDLIQDRIQTYVNEIR